MPEPTGVKKRLASDLRAAWSLISDAETPIGGGPMSIRSLDRKRKKDFVVQYSRGSRIMMHLEQRPSRLAVWIATPRALYYVAPQLQACTRWQWRDLTVRTVKNGRLFATVGLLPADTGQELEASVSAGVARQLLSLAATHGGSTA